MKKFYLLLFLIISTASISNAQNGNSYFAKDDYVNAIRAYRSEVGRDPSLYFNMARAYFGMQDFDQAIMALEQWKIKDPKCDKVKADQWLELLRRGDRPVKIENMGPSINSSNDELVPRISADGKILYFLSDDRSGGMGGEDIWYCERQPDGSWGVPKNFRAMNTSSNEGILAISPDGNVAILFGNYSGSFGGGDLFYSVKTENGWSYPCNLGGVINTKKWESLAALGPDGKTLIYSTVRDGGKGNSDLWVTQLTETGWTTPKNIGDKINTKGDDKWPFIAADGKTMYFSSDGHFGFGGADLYMTKRLDDTWTNWSEPVNLGPYINTLKDDRDFSVSGSGIYGFVTRGGTADGYGANDVYQFYVPMQYRPEQVFNVYGRVNDEKDSNAWVNIRYFDMQTGIEVNKTSTDASDGMYTVALQKGKKYEVVIDMKGYLYYSSVLDLSNPDIFRKKEPFSQKLESKRNEINQLQSKIDRLNNELKIALESSSQNIDDLFKEIENTLRDYKQALADLEIVMAEAKYQWMEEEGESLNYRQDYTLQTAVVGSKFELKNIFFDFGKATLTKESETELDKLFDIMTKSEIVIELGGHSDSIGSEEANQKLSQERVNSVKNYLVTKGIDQQRIVAVGYGEIQPIASNSTPEGRAMNRRVEVKILKLQLDREGGEDVVDDNKKKKKEPKKEAPTEVAEKGNMLELLQKAAKNGGLPSGSDCNKEVQYNPNYYTKPTKERTKRSWRLFNWKPKQRNNEKPNNYGNNQPNENKGKDNPKYNYGDYFVWQTDRIEKNDFVYKSFNLSLLNFGLRQFDNNPLGVDMFFVNKKLGEHHLQYYFSNPVGIQYGFGYDFIKNYQIKSTPLLFVWGFESKFFYGMTNTMTSDNWISTGTIPLGIRYHTSVKKLVICPEMLYVPAIWPSRVVSSSVLPETATHLRLGLNTRWRFVHGAVNLNMGPTIRYLGFRAGISF